jgi:broad specificity phosphatase PhoE
MPVRVILVRHGERIDEVDRKEWHRIRTEETKHDPPLTEAGWEQAKSAGGRIAAALQLMENVSAVTVYSSPTARTLSTAAAIVANLPGEAQSVTPMYALNCCAAAQDRGVAKAFPKGEPPDDVMRGIPLVCWPPLGDAVKVDENQKSGVNFSRVVKDVAAGHTNGDIIVIVTHREGIWDVLKNVGAPMKSGYCNVTFLSFDPSCASLQIYQPTQTSPSTDQRYATPPRHRRGLMFPQSPPRPGDATKK